MNSEMVDKLNDMTKELTSKIDNSESRLFSKLELEMKPLVNQTFEKILDATIARYHARMSEMFEKDSTSLNLSHQKMDYMIQQIQSMGNEVKALDSRLEKLESKLESSTHENEELKESSRINSDISVETEDSAITVSESDTTDDSSILELDETDRIQVSDTVVMFRRKNFTKHNNVYEGEISSSLLDIRRCAIKFPRESSQRDEEVSILEKLGTHSHVNCLIQSGVFDDGPIKSRFLVLELCYKENLDQFLRNEPYNLQQRLEYCTQIIKGMNYIHKKLIIHKDLKPANILLALDNLQCIKIADFGISQQIQSERSMVYCENCFGTIGYHPPESFGNDYISLKSDIFSLGVLFHFVLTEEESPFGPASDLWDSNIKKRIVDITLRFVPNPITFAHLFKLMMSKDRRWRPTIRQVEKHPCWTLQEEDCDFDYGFMYEVNSGSEKRDSSQLEDTDSIDDHGRLRQMLSILDPIEKEIKKEKSTTETSQLQDAHSVGKYNNPLPATPWQQLPSRNRSAADVRKDGDVWRRKLHVENIPAFLHPYRAFRSHFERFGPIEKCYLHSKKLYAYVTYRNHCDALEALCNGSQAAPDVFLNIAWADEKGSIIDGVEVSSLLMNQQIRGLWDDRQNPPSIENHIFPAMPQGSGKRERRVIKIVDPATNQDITNDIMNTRQYSMSTPPSGHSSVAGSPPITGNVAAKFAAQVAAAGMPKRTFAEVLSDPPESPDYG